MFVFEQKLLNLLCLCDFEDSNVNMSDADASPLFPLEPEPLVKNYRVPIGPTQQLHPVVFAVADSGKAPLGVKFIPLQSIGNKKIL